MLSDTLNTNEVRNASGSEVEFTRLESDKRSTVFAKINEDYARPHRLSINHTEIGDGLKKRRRSNVRVDITTTSDVDNATPVTCSFYKVADIPVGAILSRTEVANALAELDSFCSTLGSGILLDGTGNGNAALLNGSL